MEASEKIETSATCIVCRAPRPETAETARVHPNVREFRAETFRVWRCGSCASIHLDEPADLPFYYSRYPFHDLPMDWRIRTMYGSQLKRLARAGVHRKMRVLDYGCGRGDFVRYLRSRGFTDVSGFDEYSDEFGDRSVTERQYDCIISQDVVEHVPSPQGLLDRFHELVVSGGVIAVGTPNASAIDLSRPEAYEHTLHQPYHVHILSKGALLDAGAARGWELLRYYPTMYANTRVPFLNSAFYLYYLTLVDNTLDALMEPPKVLPLLLRPHLTLFWGLFGSFFARETDVMAVFRRS